MKMETGTRCYCGHEVVDDNYFECTKCKGAFHEDCLHCHGYSALGGDYLFHFTCAKCSSTGEEAFERPKLSWVQVVALALFNLQLQSSGRQGFFRWREHICCFIGQHWESFFGTNRKKASSWHSTISGTLSSNSPAIFQSGTSVFGEPGWWRLTVVQPPKLSLGALKKRSAAKAAAGLTLPSLIHDSIEGYDGSSNSVKKAKLSASASFSSVASLASPLSNHMSPDDTCSGLDELGVHIDIDDALAVLPPLDLAEVVKTELLIEADSDSYLKDEIESRHGSAEWSSVALCPASQSCSSDTASLEDTCDSDSRSTLASSRVTPVGGMRAEAAAAAVPPTKIVRNNTESAQHQCTNAMPQVNPATQMATTQAAKDEYVEDESLPVLAKPATAITLSGRKMSLYREAQLLKEMHNLVAEVSHLSTRYARFYRKLAVRKAKRDAGLPLLELTDYVAPQHVCTAVENLTCQKQGSTILDRYQAHYSHWKSSTPIPFSVRLVGCSEDQHEIIRSPYTARMLKPYIWRNYDCLPARLKLLNEIVAYPHRTDPSWSPPARVPIDFCYVRPEHIPTVNAMCHRFFWPGIDLSECLQYPDFSCVVLYKKLIIAFAFMVPDANFNEAYISFIFTHPEWRGAGIASFMLYHLIQTCMGKDVSLHVSATNPAVMLYHKFGFKAQELILNFYDKYLPPESVDCRHALALKLEK